MEFNHEFNRIHGAEAGIRTPTVLPPLDSESSASAKFRHFGASFHASIVILVLRMVPSPFNFVN